jgi:hypothetical protein
MGEVGVIDPGGAMVSATGLVAPSMTVTSLLVRLAM